MREEQIVQIVGCYGLVDAPLHWRRSLVQTLKKMGFIESRLDPCMYKLYEQGQLVGMLAIEVDDILSCGKGKHLKKMDELRSAYCFVKWINLKESKEGTSFNGRRLRRKDDGTLTIDVCKFIQERLGEVMRTGKGSLWIFELAFTGRPTRRSWTIQFDVLKTKIDEDAGGRHQ